jgi:class 3 adenylate cyclase
MNFKNLFDFFLPPMEGADEWTFRKHRVFVGVCLVSALYAIIYIPLVIIESYPGPLAVIFLFAAINITLAFLLKQKLPLKLLAHIYIATLAIAEARIMYFSGAVYQTATDPQILALLPMMALLFLGFREAILWFLIGVGIIATYGYLETHGVNFPIEMDPKWIPFQTIAAAAGHLLLIFMVINIFENQKNAALLRLSEKNKIIEEEKKRSDDLLLNILPAEVMEELKQTGKTQARNYNLVTVLFADFENFTTITEEMQPEDLVSGIDQYFEAFDHIIEKYKIEKIKTVGDAYICASGLPLPNSDNPVIMLDAAIEMMHATEELTERRKNLGLVSFNVRFGVHSGPVVAGVVGIKKFAYDIWGDTVNTAARMQQNGEAGRINISGTTHDLVKHRFNCSYRGRMEVKNKGMIDMYFVEGRKQETKRQPVA